MAVISKASGQLNSLFGKIDTPVKKHVDDMREDWEVRSMLDFVYKMDDTTNFAEAYTGETSLEDFDAVGENGVAPESDFQETFKGIIEPETWKQSFRLTLELLEDGKFGGVFDKTKKLVNAYYRTKEKFGAELLRNAQSTSFVFGKKLPKTFDIAAADGKAMFATDHPSVYGDTAEGTAAQSNVYTNEFSYDNLGLVETAMQNFLDDRGNEVDIAPDTLVFPNQAAVKQEVIEILCGDGKPTTADRAGNYQMDRWNVVFWTYLKNPDNITAGTLWGVMLDSDKNEEIGGLVWLTRLPFSMRGYVDDNTDAIVYRGRGRFTAKPVNFRTHAMFGSPAGSTLV